MFFAFFKLYKWYQIAQRSTYIVFSNLSVANIPILYPLKTPEILIY